MSRAWKPRSPCPADCAYGFRAEGQVCCQYILLTMHRRPCPPGWKDCTVYKRGEGQSEGGKPFYPPKPKPKPTQQPPKKPRKKRGRPRTSPAELEAQMRFLREERWKHGQLSQKRLAQAIGMSVDSVVGWESGGWRANWAALERAFPGITARWERCKVERGLQQDEQGQAQKHRT